MAPIDDARPEKFEGDGRMFRRWQNQVQYWLLTLGLASAIGYNPLPTIPTPPTQRRSGRVNSNVRNNQNQVETEPQISTSNFLQPPNTTASTSTVPIQTPEQINFHCVRRILGVLSNELYDIYYSYTSAQELWNELERKYGSDDEGVKRYMATDFNKFKFVDNKPMNPQIHEFENIVNVLRASGTTFSDSFLVQSFIDRLPPSWEKFASDLNRAQGALTFIQTIS